MPEFEKEGVCMIGWGTILNVVAILVGGIVGLVFSRAISPRYQETLMQAIGVCVIFVGIGGAVEGMMTVTADRLQSGGTTMIVISYAVGSLVGEWINLEQRIEQFGSWLKVKTGNAKEKRFVDAFVTASLTVCIGAMAIVGAIQDGLSGDYSTLALKAILDMVIICVMSASMGRGCLFSALPVGILQGTVTLLARAIQPIMTDAALTNLSLTGSILIFCVGVNLLWEKKLKVANMLPSIVVAVLCAFVGV